MAHHVILPNKIASLKEGVVHGLEPWVEVHRFVWGAGAFPARLCMECLRTSSKVIRCCAEHGHTGPHIYWSLPTVAWWSAGPNPFEGVAQED